MEEHSQGVFVHHQLSHKTSVFNRILSNHSAKSPLERKLQRGSSKTGHKAEWIKRPREEAENQTTEKFTNHLCSMMEGKKNLHYLMNTDLSSIYPAVKSGLIFLSLMNFFSVSSPLAHAGKAAQQCQGRGGISLHPWGKALVEKGC